MLKESLLLKHRCWGWHCDVPNHCWQCQHSTQTLVCPNCSISISYPYYWPEKSCGGQLKCLVPCTYVADLEEGPGSWVQLGPEPAIVTIWGVKQLDETFSSLCLPLFLHCYDFSSRMYIYIFKILQILLSCCISAQQLISCVPALQTSSERASLVWLQGRTQKSLLYSKLCDASK